MVRVEVVTENRLPNLLTNERQAVTTTNTVPLCKISSAVPCPQTCGFGRIWLSVPCPPAKWPLLAKGRQDRRQEDNNDIRYMEITR